ncbi:MAG: hypothetical protein KDA81_01775, partial [Planctomycetaceae bacterium]|nr:hypothetical protein [Planctomycetaceae bacterium]
AKAATSRRAPNHNPALSSLRTPGKIYDPLSFVRGSEFDFRSHDPSLQAAFTGHFRSAPDRRLFLRAPKAEPALKLLGRRGGSQNCVPKGAQVCNLSRVQGAFEKSSCTVRVSCGQAVVQNVRFVERPESTSDNQVQNAFCDPN